MSKFPKQVKSLAKDVSDEQDENNDGRITFDLRSVSARLPDIAAPPYSGPVAPNASNLDSLSTQSTCLPLNIVMQVIGSQGDIQPFIALGKGLRQHGHRVRVATHPTFRDLVQSHDLEFFSIGGNPAELMAYMVRNPGLLPKMESIHGGELQRKRRAMRNMMRACWRSCYEDPESVANEWRAMCDVGTQGSACKRSVTEPQPFVADLIIANPPSFAHVHCSERLGIPLHLVFTMPWSPTRELSHPLSNLKRGVNQPDDRTSNLTSYFLIDAMVWQGLGDIINRLRYKILGLDPITPTQAVGLTYELNIPHTYCWSPSLVPKPRDWPPNIAVPGFFFDDKTLELSSKDQLSPSVQAFLNAGPKPIYIGFGSIVVEDPQALTHLIYEAIHLTGVRAIISHGWGGLGRSESATAHIGDYGKNSHDVPACTHREPCRTIVIPPTPHTLLFPHVGLVVHHGGAGTTAAALRAGLPNIIIPFFGDQFFWAGVVHRAGAGPAPISARELTAELLAAAISTALGTNNSGHKQGEIVPAASTENTTGQATHRAAELGRRIRGESGAVEKSVAHIHATLPQVCRQGSDVDPYRVAVWTCTVPVSERRKRARHNATLDDAGGAGNPHVSNSSFRRRIKTGAEIQVTLSARAAATLLKAKLISPQDLKLYRPCDDTRFDHDAEAVGIGGRAPRIGDRSPFVEPLSGAAWSIGELFYESFKGMGEILYEVVRAPYVGQKKARDAHERRRGKGKLAVQLPATDTVPGAADDAEGPSDEGSDIKDTSTVASVSTSIKQHSSSSIVGTARGVDLSSGPSRQSLEGIMRRPKTLPGEEGESTKYGIPGRYAFKGTLRIGKAAVRAPGAFTAMMARGAHNAPKLWGDGTVRPVGRVTGVGSGLKEGVKELVYGVADGVSGVFTQPVFGFMEKGPMGFVKGTGRGVLGLGTKFFAAACGVVGYPLAGIDAEVTRAFRGDLSGEKAIRRSRMVQGEVEWAEMGAEMRVDAVKRWKDLIW